MFGMHIIDHDASTHFSDDHESEIEMMIFQN